MNRIRKTKGFTLVEIMIVVLIIGILMAIAVPNFIRARENSRKSTCIANLKQIDSAKEQWAMDNKKADADPCAFTDLTGPSGYLKGAGTGPVCPSSGTYTVGNIGTPPTCNALVGTHVLP